MQNSVSDRPSFGGNPITVSGTLPQTGDTAPNFTLTTQGLEDVTLDNWAGKRKVLNIVPSVDTPTCATSTRKFNEKASERHITHCKEKSEKKARDLKNEERQYKLKQM